MGGACGDTGVWTIKPATGRSFAGPTYPSCVPSMGVPPLGPWFRSGPKWAILRVGVLSCQRRVENLLPLLDPKGQVPAPLSVGQRSASRLGPAAGFLSTCVVMPLWLFSEQSKFSLQEKIPSPAVPSCRCSSLGSFFLITKYHPRLGCGW